MEISILSRKIEDKTLKITVFGMGRIGLPTALMFCRSGYKVIGVDINPDLLDDLNNRKSFIDEPGLPELLNNSLNQNLIELHFIHLRILIFYLLFAKNWAAFLRLYNDGSML